MANTYQYFVEGQDDEKLINVLKTDMKVILAGKVQKFNVITEEFTVQRLMTIKKGTIVVLVFDTDVQNADVLNKNLRILKESKAVKDVWCIPQVEKLEDELVKSCNIDQIKELLGSKSNHEFKRDMLREKHLQKKLEEHGFQVKKLWIQTPQGVFRNIPNKSAKIKL